MIDLPQVTLFGIDVVNPKRALNAMEWSCRHVKFAEIVLLTDTKRNPGVKPEVDLGGIPVPVRVVHHEETDRKVACPRAEHYHLPVDYEMASLREPGLHISTSHLLFHEWDSGVINPYAWDRRWLKYDYIGAMWPPHRELGWPECDGQTNNVGNGGFSLRSRRYCLATREATERFKDHPQYGPGMISSDMWPCRTIRPWLEAQGIRFAPSKVADRFSCENSIYSGQWGFHGRWTAEMNNWSGRFKNIRP